MGAKKKIEEGDITGLKFFDKLAPLLERLHQDGCERDRAGNRTLHYDQYCMLLLLYLLFNPIVLFDFAVLLETVCQGPIWEMASLCGIPRVEPQAL